MSKDLDSVIKIVNATAFEKGKTYLIKIDLGDTPTEHVSELLKAIQGLFDERGIDVILYINSIEIEAVEIKRGNENDL